MTKEQKRIKSEEFLKNQEKIIEIWKSGDKVLALILGRTIMNDRELLNFCLNNVNVFSQIGGKLNLYIRPINLTFNTFVIYYDNDKTNVSSSIPRNYQSEYNSFHRFLNKICGPRPRKPKQI